ncbi:MAG: flagellar biosynthetic protein FliR [Pseudomonadota bacterium]
MTPDQLQQFVNVGVFAFILTFVRIGTAVMIMPGIGNAYVPANVRLYFALGFTLVIAPLMQMHVPNPLPSTIPLFIMIVSEFGVGLFLGTVMRILMAAIDTAGMLIATQSSLANAQLFNPSFATQGTVIGVFLALTATMLLFATDLHHLMLTGIIESYNAFPMGELPNTGDMFSVILKEVAYAFLVAIQMSAPFLVIIQLLYIGMGVMAKLMPQVQIFMLAVPIQIYLALMALTLVMSSMMLFWLTRFDEGYQFFYQMISK